MLFKPIYSCMIIKCYTTTLKQSFANAGRIKQINMEYVNPMARDSRIRCRQARDACITGRACLQAGYPVWNGTA